MDNKLIYLPTPKVFHTYLVRWHDEDGGWKQIHVRATSQDEALEIVAGFCGYNHQVYQAA